MRPRRRFQPSFDLMPSRIAPSGGLPDPTGPVDVPSGPNPTIPVNDPTDPVDVPAPCNVKVITSARL
jgi:hypothetical protein